MDRRTRGPGVRHEQRRQEIADAVLAVVADGGVQAVSLAEVAARAGVSAGRVQHYFPAKRQLIEAAFERGNELSSARIRARAGADLDAAPPRTVLTAVLTELIAHDAETEAHLRVRQSFTALALTDEAIADRMRTDYARFHGQIADLLRRDQRDGALPADLDPAETAPALVALAEGLAYYVLIGVTSPPAARARVTDAIAALYG
ncbi:TetR/AcrR family transcriptional regulator [Actinomadura violacea]|uniref:TetR family transcriptional regulator C-terminal domain-containing protein n=1 Tax=Actinomadura violacea TaxID=2819934 RepID=A0ABS3RUF8_9ACTN|nr:TetR/AcrR family transcriptional regulator [Actinomadura violacea]MBO2459938.1 TetR family transcriptional regulator C-terminal domain-containing protein [Actinomadura violacea]